MSQVLVTDGGSRWPLPHGADPVEVLAEHGLTGRPVRATRGVTGLIEVEFAVRPLEGDRRMAVREEPRGRPMQRVAAYAIVIDDGRLLLSQLSDRVPGVGGLWSLPGGGIEPGEEPVAAVVREVHEETAQEVLVGDLVQVQSAHWVGTNAAGVEEDFHAVRLVHASRCPRPTRARVMEIDGSTGGCAWVPLAQVPSLPQTGMVGQAMRFVHG